METLRSKEIISSYQRFYKYRIDKGMSDADVCRAADVGRGVLSGWRNGTRMPSIKTLFKIAQVVDANVSDFISELSFMI